MFLNLFQGKQRSAFIARPCSGGTEIWKLASFIMLSLSSFDKDFISSALCTSESPILNLSRILEISSLLRRLVSRQDSLDGTVGVVTLHQTKRLNDWYMTDAYYYSFIILLFLL